MKDIVPFLGKSSIQLKKHGEEFLGDMYSSMNKAFNDIVKEFGSFNVSNKTDEFSPDFDIKESESGYDIKAELSGMDEKDVEVVIEENILKISGEKKEEISEKKGKYHISERKFGSFERSFTLPSNADTSSIKASFSKGILSVHINKTEKSAGKAKKIEIKGQ